MSNRARAACRASVVCTTAILVGTGVGVSTVPAWASLTGPGVETGQNITVMHNLDFVGVYGYGPTGTVITVDVIRDGHRIGTATGPTVDTPEGPGLEINHGPAGVPQAGDCWAGTTPNIRPGDRIVVTEGTDTDEVTVDDIRFTGPAVEDPTTGDVLVRGVAARADGTPIAPSSLDSGEFRDDTGKLRLAPSSTEPTAGVTNGFTMRYTAPYSIERNRNGLSLDGIKTALLTQNGHSNGIGHVVPLPTETMLVDGLADVAGPAVGCEGLPLPDPGTPVTDTVAPTLTARTPNPGAVDVAVGGNVTATFSEPVTGVSSGTVTLTSPGGTAVPAGVTYDSASRTATLNPDQDLAAGTSYTASLGSAIQDSTGNPLSATSWTFTTAIPAPPADTTAPTVTARTPNPGAVDVAVGGNVTVTFSEPVTGVSSGTVTLTSPGGTAVPAGVTYDSASRTATLNPDQDLAAGTSYTASLGSAIQDSAGNPLSATSWTFTTAIPAPPADTTAPTVTARTPASGATNVPRTADVTATFSETVTGLGTATVRLTNSKGAIAAGTVSYNSGTRTVTLNPNGTLKAQTEYRVTLTNSIADFTGNRLTTTTWTFKTGR